MEVNRADNTDFSIYNLQNLGGRPVDPKAGLTKSGLVANGNDLPLLQRAASYWNSKAEWRARVARARRYHRGNQWGDRVYDPETEQWVTEEELIKSHGKVPLKQNQIRQLVKNLMGQYLTDTTKPVVVAYKRGDAAAADMLSNTVQCGLQINRLPDVLDPLVFENFLMSGAAMWKTSFSFFDKFQRDDVFVESINMDNAFWTPNVKDPRMFDLDFIGCFWDMYKQDIIAAFAKTPEDVTFINRMYAQVIDPTKLGGGTTNESDSNKHDNQDFYIPAQVDMGRVFEIWERKVGWRLKCHDWLNAEYFIAKAEDQATIDSENMTRLAQAAKQGMNPKLVPLITYSQGINRYWRATYTTFNGDILYRGETPYDHKEHPFTLLLYPLIGGEVWGFVEDIIDQQRYVNRLVSLLDFIIGASSKGVLLVPEDAIASDFDIDKIASEWSKFNGVIKIKVKPGATIPQQIAAKATDIGIHELLNLQLRFMTEISGVSGPIQGQASPSGTPAALYAQETQNSTINSKDYFAAFGAARTERNWKMLKVQIQYYEDDRNLALAGASYDPENLVYKRERAKDVQFDMSMAKTPDSPVYRALIDSALDKFLAAGYIDFKTYLRNSSLPMADNLLNDLQNQEKLALENGMPAASAAMTPGTMAGLGNSLQAMGADASKARPGAMNMLNKYMSGLDNLN